LKREEWLKKVARDCQHEWQPLSFVFESRLIDKDGRPIIFQPGLEHARVYCVCMKCAGHTYIETHWIGSFLGEPGEHYQDEP
jgi:hypothetical protein